MLLEASSADAYGTRRVSEAPADLYESWGGGEAAREWRARVGR
ncbi:MAG: hypothetical protein R3304_07650 [Longimicrobiales bacterium]|nr:hypothetical protein [Longimicrobiales bacterium]